MYQFEITKGIICDMKRRFVSSSKQQKYEALMPSVSTVLIIVLACCLLSKDIPRRCR